MRIKTKYSRARSRQTGGKRSVRNSITRIERVEVSAGRAVLPCAALTEFGFFELLAGLLIDALRAHGGGAEGLLSVAGLYSTRGAISGAATFAVGGVVETPAFTVCDGFVATFTAGVDFCALVSDRRSAIGAAVAVSLRIGAVSRAGVAGVAARGVTGGVGTAAFSDCEGFVATFAAGAGVSFAAVIVALGSVFVADVSMWLSVVAGRAERARGWLPVAADSDDAAVGLRRTAGVLAVDSVAGSGVAATLIAGLRAGVVFSAGATLPVSAPDLVTRAAVLRGAGFAASPIAESALRVTRRRGTGSGGRSSLMTGV